MRRRLFWAGMAWRPLIALILALCLVPIFSSPAAASDTLSIGGYFEISYEPAEFSKTEVRGDEIFRATIEGTATCIKDLPLPVSKAYITSRIIAEHQTSGTKVALNSSYRVTIEPFPNEKGDIIQARQDISLQFPAGSQSGTYSVVGELIEAKINTLIGWLTVTFFLPSSEAMGSLTYVAPDESGGGVPTPPDTTYISDNFDWQGIALQPFTVMSADGKCTLAVNKGTKALTKYDQPLKQVSIVSQANPLPPPADAEVIGLTYDLGPDGAIFDPPIDLTFAYNQGSIPEGVTEKDLVIAMWDISLGEWVVLDDCIVNTSTHTITVKVVHFTDFAVLAYTKPAAFIISALSITPQEVNIGDEVTISAMVTNTGNLRGICRVVLKIDSEVVEIQEVILAGGASDTAAFKVSENVASIYSVNVNDLSGSFLVKPAAMLESTPTHTLPSAEPINWLVLGGVIAAVAVVGLLIFFVARRRFHTKSSV